MYIYYFLVRPNTFPIHLQIIHKEVIDQKPHISLEKNHNHIVKNIIKYFDSK